MLHTDTIFAKILDQIDHILADKPEVQALWSLFIAHHPADIAEFLLLINEDQKIAVFNKLPQSTAGKVLERVSSDIQVLLLENMPNDRVALILRKMHSDKLTDLFEHLSDEDLKKYLKMLQKRQRSLIISHLNFAPKSAGRIMNSDVLTLEKDITVKKCISLLQRLSPQKDLHRHIFVTDHDNILCGFVRLDDLVINKPDTPLKQILSKNILRVNAHEDQEDVAHKMRHYNLFSCPVVDQHDHFLGVITADDIFDVLEEEATEDVYKMSGLMPVDHSYFDTSIWSIVKQRSIWLSTLLLLQSVSSMIVNTYADLMSHHVIITFFMTMLIGTGGNAGNQSATLVIRGMATGEITRRDSIRLFFRELGISIIMAAILVVLSFSRVYLIHRDFISSCAISISLFLIIIASMVLGTLIPLIFERLGIDPAHSAAPLLATVMDILGMFIYCLVCNSILQ